MATFVIFAVAISDKALAAKTALQGFLTSVSSGVQEKKTFILKGECTTLEGTNDLPLFVAGLLGNFLFEILLNLLQLHTGLSPCS